MISGRQRRARRPVLTTGRTGEHARRGATTLSAWREGPDVRASPSSVTNHATRPGRAAGRHRAMAVDRPCRPAANPRIPAHPTAPGAGDGWRSHPCGRRREPPHSSTRVRSPSDALPCRPCWQSRAVCFYPLKRIRDLPWPRCASLPCPVPRFPDEVHRSSLPRVLQHRYHEHIDSLGDRGAVGIGAGWDEVASQLYRRGAFCQVDSEAQSDFWADAYPFMSSDVQPSRTLINTGA